MRIATTDLYEAAYLLTEGAELKQVWHEGTNGRSRAVFEVEGAEVESLLHSFRRGEALCNVVVLRSTLNQLKDALFSCQRRADGMYARPRRPGAVRPGGRMAVA